MAGRHAGKPKKEEPLTGGKPGKPAEIPSKGKHAKDSGQKK